MAKFKVLLRDPIHPHLHTILAPTCDVVVAGDDAAFDAELPHAHAWLSLLSAPVKAKDLERAKELKVVGNYAVGTDNIDVEWCHAHDVPVVHTPDVLTEASAEMALTLALCAARRVGEGERLVRSGQWTGWAPDQLLGRGLVGQRAVVVGGGRIGGLAKKLFEGIGMNVTVIGRHHSDAEIEHALSQCRLLSLHVPLTDVTRGWLSRERIAQLSADAIVVNTARGPVVDEEALADALAAEEIFAAGLDVYDGEPNVREALLALDNVVLAPHLGSATSQTREDMARILGEGVLTVLNGRMPENVLTPRS